MHKMKFRYRLGNILIFQTFYFISIHIPPFMYAQTISHSTLHNIENTNEKIHYSYENECFLFSINPLSSTKVNTLKNYWWNFIFAFFIYYSFHTKISNISAYNNRNISCKWVPFVIDVINETTLWYMAITTHLYRSYLMNIYMVSSIQSFYPFVFRIMDNSIEKEQSSAWWMKRMKNVFV